jgi:hypothetical protein
MEGTVVGFCLLDLEAVRPSPLPAGLGVQFRAAAHRIAVEWPDGNGGVSVGVYIPMRHNSSRAARVVGGRLFPGVHRAASLAVADDGRRVDWMVTPTGPEASTIRVLAAVRDAEPASLDDAGGVCVTATVGISPGLDGELEAAAMQTGHRVAYAVEVDYLASDFLASFSTARPVTSYVMRDVPVRWTPVPVPTPGSVGAMQ